MNDLIWLMTIFASLTTATSALADATTIATGGVYGGPGQMRAFCYVWDAGSDDYYIGSAEIIQQNGEPADENTAAVCDLDPRAPFYLIPAGTMCHIAADVAPDSTYSCRWTINDSRKGVKPLVRGTLDMRDADGKVLVSSPLR